MKRIFNWITLLLVAYLAINGMLFYVLYSEVTKLPDEDWSRGYAVDEYHATDQVVYNVIYPMTLSMEYKDHILMASFSEGQVNITELDAQLETLSTHSFTAGSDDISDFRSFVDGSGRLILYLKERVEDGIFRYVYDPVTGQVLSEQSIQIQSRKVAYSESAVLVFGDNRLVLWEGETQQVLSEGIRYENIAIFDFEGTRHILTVESRMGQDRMLKHYLLEDGALVPQENVSSLVSGDNYNPEELEVLVSLDHVKIFVKTVQQRFNQNYINIMNYDPIEDQIVFSYDYYNEMSQTNSRIIDTPSDEITFIQALRVDLGMRDISSKDETYYNLFIETYTAGGLTQKMLTKTIYLSNHPNYYEVEGHHYLQWTEARNGEIVVLFSSDEPQLVEQSVRMMDGEFPELLSSTISSNFLMFYFILSIAVSIIAPIALTILPISIIFFNWAEKNQGKLFGMMIAIHLVSKFLYIYRFIGKYAAELSRMPGVLNQVGVQYILAMGTTVVAYLCMLDFSARRKVHHFIFRYLFFFMIDIILLVLILVPYRML